MKPLEPLRVADVSLTSGHMLGIARIDEEDSKATGIEELENRNPIHAGRFHNDRLDATFLKPIHQPMQIGNRSCVRALTAAMCIVAPTSMAAAFGWTIGIVRFNLDLVLF